MYGMKRVCLVLYFVSITLLRAQTIKSGPIISGPMLGQVEMRTASIWLQVTSEINYAILIYWKQGHPEKTWQKIYDGVLGKEFNPIRFEVGDLDFNSTYEYEFVLNQKKYSSGGNF